jgi:hypothetical protein
MQNLGIQSKNEAVEKQGILHPCSMSLFTFTNTTGVVTFVPNCRYWVANSVQQDLTPTRLSKLCLGWLASTALHSMRI